MSDPYLFESSRVLRNTLDIKDADSLEAYENTVVNLALLKLFKEDYIVTQTNQLFDIHKRLLVMFTNGQGCLEP